MAFAIACEGGSRRSSSEIDAFAASQFEARLERIGPQ
jgi:hypothetical protein